jgi:Translin family
MRRAITNISSRQGKAVAIEICTSLRQILSMFQRLYVPYSGPRGFTADLTSKIEVMRASVSKVENACYNDHVRGSERPEGWAMELKEDQGYKRGGPNGDDEDYGRSKRRRFNED